MTADYCTWFLKHFKNYNYYGEEAQNLKRRLTRISERLSAPPEAEIIEVYVAFLRLYNADIFSVKSKKYPGIRPKTGDYFLIFYMDDTPVPMAYLSEKTVISENDIRDAIITEREKKLKYFQDVSEYQMSKRTYIRNLLEEAHLKFSATGSGLTVVSFVIFAILALVAAVMFFFSGIKKYFGFDSTVNYTIIALSFLAFVTYILLAVFGNKKYSYYSKSREIVDKMLEIQDRIDNSVLKIKQSNTQDIRLAIRNGKKIKPLFEDIDYGIELRYIETSVELLEHRLDSPKSSLTSLYVASSLSLGYVVSTLTLGVMSHNGHGSHSYIAVLAICFIDLLLIILFRKKIRIYRVIIIALLSSLLAIIYAMYLNNLI